MWRSSTKQGQSRITLCEIFIYIYVYLILGIDGGVYDDHGSRCDNEYRCDKIASGCADPGFLIRLDRCEEYQ